MNWVVVNYTVVNKNEIFDVSEAEEKNKKLKKTKPLKYIIKKLYPFILFIINQIQMPKKKQSEKFKIWRAYVKYMLDRNQGTKSLKYLLKNYSKKEYAEFKKKPMRFI